jgi:threonine dehydrogenase-like Zn-dependent dehydrogenase
MLMQALTVAGPGELSWADVPAPTLRDGRAALVRPVLVATCDFDHLIVGGRAPVPYPVHLGHEMVAEVVAVGDEVQSVRVGEEVVVPFQITCGGCRQCRAGRTSSCDELSWLSCYGLGESAGGWGGVVCDLVGVPYADAMLVRPPANLRSELAAAAGCNLTDAYRCVVPQLRENPDEPVLVVTGGFQNIGLACVAFARALSRGPVHVLGLAPELAAKAQRIGADVIGSGADVGRHQYPIVVETSLDPELLAIALRATAPGGTCTISAMYTTPLTPVPLLDLFAACATVSTGQPHVRALLPDVLALLADEGFPGDVVIDAVHPWADAITAFTIPGKHVISRR